jgi:uncharacterized cupin superfamily protein
MKHLFPSRSGFVLILLLSAIFIITLSAGKLINSSFYDWANLKMIRSHIGSSVTILKGPTRSLEMFYVKAVTLHSRKETHRYLIEKGCDEMIIIKEGTAEITINTETKQLEPGSIAVASQGDRVLIRNTQPGSLTFYSFFFRPRQAGEVQSQSEAKIPHLFKEWSSLEFKPSANGGRRDIMRQPTSSLRELEIHTTTLKEGLPSHNAHTHTDEEIILVRYGIVEESINGTPHTLGPGSVIFLTNDDSHAIRNAGSGACEYYAIRWLVNATGQNSQ